jgi:hypothetical protein
MGLCFHDTSLILQLLSMYLKFEYNSQFLTSKSLIILMVNMNVFISNTCLVLNDLNVDVIKTRKFCNQLDHT